MWFYTRKEPWCVVVVVISSPLSTISFPFPFDSIIYLIRLWRQSSETRKFSPDRDFFSQFLPHEMLIMIKWLLGRAVTRALSPYRERTISPIVYQVTHCRAPLDAMSPDRSHLHSANTSCYIFARSATASECSRR